MVTPQKPALVRGTTAHGKNEDSAYTNLSNHIGDEVEVKTADDKFVGTIKSVEERLLDGTRVGATVTIDIRRGGPTIELSTFFKDDDFDEKSYIKEF